MVGIIMKWIIKLIYHFFGDMVGDKEEINDINTISENTDDDNFFVSILEKCKLFFAKLIHPKELKKAV